MTPKDKEMLAKVAVATSVGLGAALLAPVVIPAVVGALGFGGGGIVAGSPAAWFMSLGGGVTPAAVSVGQSIGATGAIAFGTKATVGTATAKYVYKNL